jgi:hypothetical protein
MVIAPRNSNRAETANLGRIRFVKDHTHSHRVVVQSIEDGTIVARITDTVRKACICGVWIVAFSFGKHLTPGGRIRVAQTYTRPLWTCSN